MRENDLEQINAVIQSTFHIDPEALSDEDFVRYYAKYKLIEEIKQKTIIAAVLEAAKILFDGNSCN